MNPSKPSQPSIEIERKWLVAEKDIPKDQIISSTVILQGYLEVSADKEVRIRSKANKYYQTTKAIIHDSNGSIKRYETEDEISADEFNLQWPQTKGRRIEKCRHIIKLADSLKAEVDIFTGANQGLIIAEVEFPDDSTSKNFQPPSWFSEEVTPDERYKNKNLAS